MFSPPAIPISEILGSLLFMSDATPNVSSFQVSDSIGFLAPCWVASRESKSSGAQGENDSEELHGEFFGFSWK